VKRNYFIFHNCTNNCVPQCCDLEFIARKAAPLIYREVFLRQTFEENGGLESLIRHISLGRLNATDAEVGDLGTDADL